MDKIRLLYTQTGRAVWPSHLDTMRTLQRSLNRAGVPIRYSEGFNPHAMISILMPLSVGTESRCQIVEIRVKEEIDLALLPEKLTSVMPEGFKVIHAYENGKKPAEAKWLKVSGFWDYDDKDPGKMAELCRNLFSGSVEVMRKTKHGEGLFTVSDHIQTLQFIPDCKRVLINAVVSCFEPVVNPDLITAAVRQNLPECTPDGGHFCREEIYTAEMEIFR